MAKYGTEHLYITVPFVAAGVLRYLQITFVEERSGSPTLVVLTDRFLITAGLGWLAVFGYLIYGCGDTGSVDPGDDARHSFWTNKGYQLYWHSTPSESDVGTDAVNYLERQGWRININKGGDSVPIARAPGGSPSIRG